MTESKFKRLIVALTVGAVMLMVILLSVMVYQMVRIGVETRREKEYTLKLQELEELIQQGKKDNETLSERWCIERLAREYGYYYADDVILNEED